MTVKEWRDKNTDECCVIEWAEDAGSFGKKGWSAYGDTSDCEVVWVKPWYQGSVKLGIKLPY